MTVDGASESTDSRPVEAHHGPTGFAAGIEAAASWHDAQAAELTEIPRKGHNVISRIQDHRRSAESIRAIAALPTDDLLRKQLQELWDHGQAAGNGFAIQDIIVINQYGDELFNRVVRVWGVDRQPSDLVALISLQIPWSRVTFGDSRRHTGITAHIEKELAEVRADPTDVVEWLDIAILALDGAWRAMHHNHPKLSDVEVATSVVQQLAGKMAKNRARKWPPNAADDDTVPGEHIRE